MPLQECHMKYLLSDTSQLNVKPLMEIMYWDKLGPSAFWYIAQCGT